MVINLGMCAKPSVLVPSITRQALLNVGMCGVSDNTEKTDTVAPILTLSAH